jgi:putative transposase
MGRRGNPCANANASAKAESFIKTLKIEAVRPMAFEIFEDVAAEIPRAIGKVQNARGLYSVLGYRSPDQFEDNHARRTIRTAARCCPAPGCMCGWARRCT